MIWERLGESCRIKLKSGGGEVIFSVEGDVGKASSAVVDDKTSAKEEEHTEIVCGDSEVSGMFGVKYLALFTKAAKLCDSVGVYMTEGVPLFVNYDMGEIGAVGYYLAPKIEDD